MCPFYDPSIAAPTAFDGDLWIYSIATFREIVLPLSPTHIPFVSISRLGVFWASPNRGEARDIVAVSRAFAEVPQIGGVRTLGTRNVELWSRVRPQAVPKAIGEYECHPRGRLNWRKAGHRCPLLRNPTLHRPSWVACVMGQLTLPVGGTPVMMDLLDLAKRKPPIDPLHAPKNGEQ